MKDRSDIEPLRLQKYLAQCALGSRRHCETLVAEGRVTINGEVVAERGARIDPECDEVSVDGHPVRRIEERRVLMLHKPQGYVTTRKDPYGKENVYQLLPESMRLQVFPIGRLDKDTEGLLLFSNDGQLAFRLMHPRYSVEKTYEITVEGTYERDRLRPLEEGIRLGDRLTAPAKVTRLRSGKTRTVFSLTIHEGRKRQIRRMCRALGLKLLYLKRYRQGPIDLGNLPKGKWRFLDEKEIQQLEAATQSDKSIIS